jgi:hypothetical protein
MGDNSSEWSYSVPYEADISAALQKLREDVFARGEYLTQDSFIDTGTRLIFPPARQTPKPSTIEELLEQEREYGTHSILDINCISPTPRRRAISPFPKELMVDYFRTETPSSAEIYEVYEFGSLEEFVTKRWKGIYIVSYEDAIPSEIFFAGCSGD